VQVTGFHAYLRPQISDHDVAEFEPKSVFVFTQSFDGVLTATTDGILTLAGDDRGEHVGPVFASIEGVLATTLLAGSARPSVDVPLKAGKYRAHFFANDWPTLSWGSTAPLLFEVDVH
jgi:hypothetical protein